MRKSSFFVRKGQLINMEEVINMKKSTIYNHHGKN